MSRTAIGLFDELVVIDLCPYESECRVCGAEIVAPSSGPSYGVAVWEDLLVTDDAKEWGGADACLRCYLLVRGMAETGMLPVRILDARRIALRKDA